LRLVGVVSRETDHRVWAQYSSRCLRGKIVLAKMDAINLQRQRDIDTVVD